MRKLILLIALALPAFATITQGNHAGTYLNANNCTVVLDTTGADLIVFFASYQYSTSPTMVDLTYGNPVIALPKQGETGQLAAQFWIVVHPFYTGSSHSFQIAMTGLYPSCYVRAYTGSSLGALASSTGGYVTSGTSMQAGSVTPDGTNELVVTGVTSSGTTATAIDSSFAITNSQNTVGGSANGGAMADLVETSAVTVNPTWSGMASGHHAAAIAVFRAADSSGATPWKLLSYSGGVLGYTSPKTLSLDTTGAKFLAFSISSSPTAAATISADSKGATWTCLTNWTTPAVRICYSFPGANVGSGHTVTVSGSSNITASAYFLAFTGPTSPAYDKDSGTGVTAITCQPGSLTPAANGELLITATAVNSQDAGISPKGNVSWVGNGYQVSDHYGGAIGLSVIQDTSAQNPTWNDAVSGSISCAAALFRATASTKRRIITTTGEE